MRSVRIYRNGQWENRYIRSQTHDDGNYYPLGVHQVLNLYAEDPRPYEFPATRPYNPPVTCQVPTYDGSNKTTHPAVVDFHLELGPGRTFQGYRYWMAHTPYPRGDAQLENPSIVASNNGWDWHDPYGITNPIAVEPPDSSYFNADPDLAWNPEERRLEMVWKLQVRDPRSIVYMHSMSYDGITWTPEDPITYTPDAEQSNPSYVSPSLVRVGAYDWRLIGVTSGKFITFTAPSPKGPWGDPKNGEVEGIERLIEGERIWHPDVVLDDGVWWMLTSTRDTRTDIYPLTSLDGINWVLGEAVILDEPGSDDYFKYRPTLVPHENGTHMRVWYSERGTMEIRYTLIPKTEWPTL